MDAFYIDFGRTMGSFKEFEQCNPKIYKNFEFLKKIQFQLLISPILSFQLPTHEIIFYPIETRQPFYIICINPSLAKQFIKFLNRKFGDFLQ